MALNRRAFLQRFGIGVGAALTLAALPASAVEALSVTDAGRRCAIEYLRHRWIEHMRGRSVTQAPPTMYVPQGLFDAYEGELTACVRFVLTDGHRDGPRWLSFKGAKLFADPAMPKAWDVRFTDRPPRGVEYAMNTTGAVYA